MTDLRTYYLDLILELIRRHGGGIGNSATHPNHFEIDIGLDFTYYSISLSGEDLAKCYVEWRVKEGIKVRTP